MNTVSIQRSRSVLPASSDGDSQGSRGVSVVDLAQNLVRQLDTINPPTALRRNLRRSVVKILVVGFEETIIDFVQLIVEDLLRKFVADRLFKARERKTA